MAKQPLCETTIEAIASFTALMYGGKETRQGKPDLDEQRYKTFEKVYAPKSNSRHPLEKLRGIDSSSIPPCKAEITQHIRKLVLLYQLLI